MNPFAKLCVMRHRVIDDEISFRNIVYLLNPFDIKLLQLGYIEFRIGEKI